MSGTDGVELKSAIDTDLPWKMVAKGSRSSTRRTKKSVSRVSAPDIEAEDKSSMDTVTRESESEKVSVSVQGQQFTDRVEHIPIKKRRFMVRSLSSSNRSSAKRECSEQRVQINHTLPVSRLNPNLIGRRTSDVPNEMPDCSGHDFSGIEILAAAACSSHMSNDLAPVVDHLPTEDRVVQKQDASTLSTHVEVNDSSAGTADVSTSKNDIVAPQKSSVETLCNDMSDEKSSAHRRVSSCGMMSSRKTSIALSDESSTERPKANMEASESENVAPDSGAVSGSVKQASVEPAEKNNEGLKDVRLHWDLNVTMDAWGQPCDAEDEASGRDVGGVITESIAAKEIESVDGNETKDHLDVVVESDGRANISSPSKPKAEAVASNGKECQSGYDSQFEDGELREPYPWEDNEGDRGEIEQVDYGSEPEDERFYSLAESNDTKMEDSGKGILTETDYRHVKCESDDAPKICETNEGSDIEKHVVVCMNDSHLKKRSSSPSRSFASKPYKELRTDDTLQRRRPYNYEELSTGPDKFVGRDDRSGMHMRNRSPGRGYYSRWDSNRRFSPPNYKGGSYGFERPRPKTMVDDRVLVNDFDQSGSGPGPGPGANGYVRRQFSNGGYRGRFRRFTDGGDRDFRGPHSESNQFPGRMHNRMGSSNRIERGNSPVFRRLHHQQSEPRSRSRSPVSWNSRNRSSPPPPPGGFRGEERMMERMRLPFQKRFPADQEMGFMSPPRNRMSPPPPRCFGGRNNDYRDNYHNSFKERKFRPGQRFDVGNTIRRVNSENNNNHHIRPFVRHRRFEGAEDNNGRDRFERSQRAEATEDGSDDVRRFRFHGEQQPVVVATNNNIDNKES